MKRIYNENPVTFAEFLKLGNYRGVGAAELASNHFALLPEAIPVKVAKIPNGTTFTVKGDGLEARLLKSKAGLSLYPSLNGDIPQWINVKSKEQLVALGKAIAAISNHLK